MTLRAAAIALLVLTEPSLRAADWPGYLGPDRNAVSPESDWNTDWTAREPARLWKTDVGTGCSAIAIAGGKAFTMGHRRGHDHVLCLDAFTGKKIWEHRYPQNLDDGLYEGGPSATPTVDGGRVYSVSKNGDLFCLDAATGKPLWSKSYLRDFGGRRQIYGWSASPLVHGNLLVIDPGGPGASVVALDKITGETAWQSGDEEPAYASPVLATLPSSQVVDGRITAGPPDSSVVLVALFQKTGLFGYRAADGQPLFRFHWTTEWDINASIPLFRDDTVFLSSGYGSGCGLIDLSENAWVYRNRNLFLQFQHGILLGDHLYAVSGDNDSPGELKCLELATGDVRWSNRYGGCRRGSLLLAGEKLLVLTERGELILVAPSPARYIELHRMQALPATCWAPPAFANGLLYCRTNTGDARCYDLRKK